MQTNLLGTMSNLPPFMPQIVLKFYVNLSKNMEDPSSPNFQKATMQGHRFEFSRSIINQYLECEDVLDDEIEVLETNRTQSIIIGGNVQMWPQKYNL